MPQVARGPFEIKLSPQQDTDALAFEGFARLGLDKVFHGALEASSKGQMLSFRTPVEGSAVYVAMESVTGTLDGRQGSFVLHHTGIMNRGSSSLEIRVVPDSGSGELQGLSGTVDIEIAPDGAHSYVFDYSLP